MKGALTNETALLAEECAILADRVLELTDGACLAAGLISKSKEEMTGGSEPPPVELARYRTTLGEARSRLTGLPADNPVGITAPTEAENRRLLHTAPIISETFRPNGIVTIANQPSLAQIEHGCLDSAERASNLLRDLTEFHASGVTINDGVALIVAEWIGISWAAHLTPPQLRQNNNLIAVRRVSLGHDQVAVVTQLPEQPDFPLRQGPIELGQRSAAIGEGHDQEFVVHQIAQGHRHFCGGNNWSGAHQ